MLSKEHRQSYLLVLYFAILDSLIIISILSIYFIHPISLPTNISLPESLALLNLTKEGSNYKILIEQTFYQNTSYFSQNIFVFDSAVFLKFNDSKVYLQAVLRFDQNLLSPGIK
jgi:hypothetical protein